MRTPFFLRGNTIINTTSGNNLRSNVTIKNPAKTGIWITEFRFGYVTKENADANYGNPVDLIRTKIKINQWDATLGKDVPIALMCPLADDYAYWQTNHIPGYGPGGRAIYAWKLSKPMYLPYNGQVSFDFVVADDFVGLSITDAAYALREVAIDVGLVGYSAQPGETPGIVAVPCAIPWLTATLPQDLTTIGGTIPNGTQSGVSDLKNGKKYPLNIDYLTATAMLTTALAGPLPEFRDGFGDSLGTPVLATALMGAKTVGLRNGIRLQMRDTRGAHVVRDPTPLAMVVNPTTRAWRMNTVLAPNNYFIATFSGQWELDNAAFWAEPPRGLRLGLGLVGYHEIPIADLGVFP